MLFSLNTNLSLSVSRSKTRSSINIFLSPQLSTESSSSTTTTTMMHMTFYWSKQVTLLVDAWRTNSWLDYSLTLLACLLASAFYQFMEDRRMRLRAMATTASGSRALKTTSVEHPLLQPSGGRRKIESAARLTGAVLFGVNAAIGYLLMLAVMSFNGGVFLSVVLGLSVGYYLFRSDDENLAAVDNPFLDNPCGCV